MGNCFGKEEIEYRQISSTELNARYQPPSFLENDERHQSSAVTSKEWSDSEAILVAANACRNSVDFEWREEALLHIGCRNSKNSFLVRRRTPLMDNVLYTVLPRSASPLRFGDSATEGYRRLLGALSMHPLFASVMHAAVDRSCLSVYRVFEGSTGSLKDEIYRAKPKQSYHFKYPGAAGGGGSGGGGGGGADAGTGGLPLAAVAKYGRQVLEALAFLHARGLFHLHLHSGNVLLGKSRALNRAGKRQGGNVARLSDFENGLLALERAATLQQYTLPLEHERRKAQSAGGGGGGGDEGDGGEGGAAGPGGGGSSRDIAALQEIDVLLFGRLLYEMAFGREMGSVSPDYSSLGAKVPEEVAAALDLIFGAGGGSGGDRAWEPLTATRLLNQCALFARREAADDADVLEAKEAARGEAGAALKKALGRSSTKGVVERAAAAAVKRQATLLQRYARLQGEVASRQRDAKSAADAEAEEARFMNPSKRKPKHGKPSSRRGDRRRREDRSEARELNRGQTASSATIATQPNGQAEDDAPRPASSMPDLGGGGGGGGGGGSDDPKFKQYNMMRKARVPEGAIRLKMEANSVSAADIALFLGE